MTMEESSPEAAGSVVPRFDFIASAIQARHIATPLGASFSVGTSSASERVAVELHDCQFDNAVVIDDSGTTVGLFSAQAAAKSRPVGDCMRPLSPDLLVSGDAAIPEMTRYLAREPFLFVLSGHSIAGFVTPADVGRPQSRTFFYLILADLEVALATYVRSRFADQDAAFDCLSEGRKETIMKLIHQLKQEDQFIDLVSAMGLVDLVRVAKDSPLKGTVEAAGVSWRQLEHGLGGFRNDVMHPVRPFCDATSEAMAVLVRRIRTISVLADAARAQLSEDGVRVNEDLGWAISGH